MEVVFTQEMSFGVLQKFRFIVELEKNFHDKNYGEDLKILMVSVSCMDGNFFKDRRPIYREYERKRIYRGTELVEPAKLLSYGLNLDYDYHVKTMDSRPMFYKEVLESIGVICRIKKIKDFNFEAFKHDLADFFELQLSSHS